MKDKLIIDYNLYKNLYNKFYGYAFEYFIKYIKLSNEMLSFIDASFSEHYINIYYKNVENNTYHNISLSVDNFINFIKDNYEEEKYYS